MTVMPIVGLSAVGGMLGLTKPVNWVLSITAWIAAPVIIIYILFSITVILAEWDAWLRAGSELSLLQTTLVPVPPQVASPATLHWIEQLPTVNVSDVCLIENSECIVCLESCTAQEGLRLLQCGHRPMCNGCLLEWMERQKQSARCPLCRCLMLTGSDMSRFFVL